MTAKYLKALIPLFIFVVLAWFMYERLNNTTQPSYVPSQQVGKPAADFELPQLLDPEKTISKKELLGQVWVLNIWGSWCPTCRYEHPVLTRFAKTGLAPLYGLNWKDENRNDAVQWLATYKNPYVASGYDPSGRTGMDYGAYAAPETFIIDKEGIVRFHFRGEVTDELVQTEMVPRIKVFNLEVGKSAAGMMLPHLEDPSKRVSTEALLGKVWVLNTWGTWCQSCRDGESVLSRFAKSGIAPLYGINWRDENHGAPDTFVIDKQGVVRFHFRGEVTEELVQTEMMPLIKELNQ